MPPSPALEPAFPERVGRYTLVAPVGSGGLATVYLARAEGAAGFARSVAVKLLHPHLRAEVELTAQLVQEAKLVACIQHPNVVQMLDVGEDPQGIYLVMEYVEGEPLVTLMRAAQKSRRPVPRSIAFRILCDALEGLHAAHELCDEDGAPLGLVHRDFSPHNILVGVDGSARLIDFGIAKVARATAQTRTGLIKGKVAYMAPEQARAQTVDRRTDVWAAGVVAWELSAARRLFRNGDDIATMLAIVSGTTPRLCEVVEDVPPALDEVVARALELDPGQRPPTARRLRDQLVAALPEQLASSAEVADYLQQVAGDRIEERRRRLESTRSAVIAAPRSSADEAPDNAASTVHAMDDAEATDTAGSLAVRPAPKRRSRAIFVALGAAGAVVALVWAAQQSGQGRAGATTDSNSEPAARASTAASDAAPRPAAASSAPAAAAGRHIEVSANVPVAGLRIAGRSRKISPPEDHVVADVAADAGALEIEVQSEDGRWKKTRVAADAESVAVEFPQRHRATTVRARPRATPRPGPPPLSPNPYDPRR